MSSLPSPEIRAIKVAEIIKKAAASSEPQDFFRRSFDDMFENFDGELVVVEFVKLYNADDALKDATQKVNNWIGIEGWLETYKKWEQRNPTFEF